MTRSTPSMVQYNRASFGMHSTNASTEPLDAILRALNRLESRVAEMRMMIAADQGQLQQLEREIIVLQGKLGMGKSVVDGSCRTD
jgi:hypothetical protein